MHVQYLTSQLAPPKMEVFDLELLTEEFLVCTRARRALVGCWLQFLLVDQSTECFTGLCASLKSQVSQRRVRLCENVKR